MKRFGKSKAAMLAAVSVIAATAALSPAGASDMDMAGYPSIVTVESPQTLAHAADHAADEKPASVKKWALITAAAGALAGLVRLIGARRVAEIVTESAVKTARAAAGAASGAARAVGRAVSSPLRYLAVLFGLALFALTGAGLYDVEWIGGLVSGAALVAAGLYGMWKTRRALAPARVKQSHPPSMDNGN